MEETIQSLPEFDVVQLPMYYTFRRKKKIEIIYIFPCRCQNSFVESETRIGKEVDTSSGGFGKEVESSSEGFVTPYYREDYVMSCFITA